MAVIGYENLIRALGYELGEWKGFTAPTKVVKVYHGGLCCGIKHRFQMDYAESSKDYIPARGEDGTPILTEIVLIHHQLAGSQGKQHLENLEKFGYRLVSTFLNPNSDNWCYVFHSTPDVTREYTLEDLKERYL